MAEIEEVARRKSGAGEAVARDDRDALVGPCLDGDDRDVVGQLQDRVRSVGLRCDHEDPVDPLKP